MNRWIRAALQGTSIGIAIAAMLSGLMAIWDWCENPGGIFRSVSGTQWHYVWGTFISWLGPTLPSFGMTGAGVLLARQWWRQT
ncbi:hypothetical protein KUV89_03480 [Marinobacter hydrocarbonoclasticus]|nr:hypothetical protein [Marinobacter nauticus]